MTIKKATPRVSWSAATAKCTTSAKTKKFDLNVSGAGDNYVVIYTSSDTRVAEFNRGAATIKGKCGKTTITAIISGKNIITQKASFVLTVRPAKERFKVYSKGNKIYLTRKDRIDTGIKWTKVQVAKNKKFKGKKSYKITNKKNMKKAIKITKGKRYYVRYRCESKYGNSDWTYRTIK